MLWSGGLRNLRASIALRLDTGAGRRWDRSSRGGWSGLRRRSGYRGNVDHLRLRRRLWACGNRGDFRNLRASFNRGWRIDRHWCGFDRASSGLDDAHVASATVIHARNWGGVTFCSGVALTQVYGIVAFAFPVNGDERSSVVAVETVMRRERLRGLAAEEPPLRALCARSLRHATIVARRESIGSVGYGECRGRKTCTSGPAGVLGGTYRGDGVTRRPKCAKSASRSDG